MKKLSSKQIDLIWYWVATVSRLILGCTFIFSGFVKAVDPLGTTYKIEDYLNAFGGWWQNLLPMAEPAAYIMIAFEFTLGVLLLLNIWINLDSWLALLFLCVMTPLTLYLAIANPVTDCGCFGDAVVLTNWQTFGKNIILFILLIFLFIGKRTFRQRFVDIAEWMIFLISLLAVGGLMLYARLVLPPIDFRPYKVGNVIREGMEMPEGAKADVYRVTFVYEKDGVQQEFTIDDYPKNDSTWTFVDQKSVLVEKGYVPPIHDFIIISDEDGDITDDILDDEGTTVMAVMYDLNKANRKQVEKINKIAYEAEQNGYRFYALTGSSTDDIEAFKEETGARYEICFLDPIQLKTIVRANPGVFVVRNGVIIEKYNVRQKDVSAIVEPEYAQEASEEDMVEYEEFDDDLYLDD